MTIFDFGNGNVPAHRHVNGGGWVADSIPELEWKEVLNKGRVIFKAAEMVQEKLKG